MSTPSSIHILLCTDAKFAPYCGVTAFSAIRNCGGQHVVIHIFTDGLPTDEINRFKSLEQRYDCEVDIVTVSESESSCLPHDIKQWPPATFMRLLAARLLPDNLHRVIYLDCDVIVDTDLRSLWEYDLGGMVCGAVTEEEGHNSDLMIGVLNVVHNLDPSQKYFNSGVMLMDFNLIRKNRYHIKALKLIKDYGDRLSCPDQDALNIVLRHQWMPLPLKWNMQSRFFFTLFFKLLHNHERDMMRDIACRRIQGIIHYTGWTHPWDRDSFLFHPFWYLWDRALHRSHHNGINHAR